VAIEVDPYLVHYLRQKFQGAIDAGRLVLIEGDILKVDLGAISPRRCRRQSAYYITSPILDRIFFLEWRVGAGGVSGAIRGVPPG